MALNFSIAFVPPWEQPKATLCTFSRFLWRINEMNRKDEVL